MTVPANRRLPGHVPDSARALGPLDRRDHQCPTTIYGLDDRYRGVKGGRRPAEGDRVDLISESAGADGAVQERRAEDCPVVAYSDHVAVKSNTPASKPIVIRLEKV